MNEANKKAAMGLAAAVVIGTVATGIVYFAGESQAYVAKVNGTSIHSTEYDKQFEQTKKQYSSRFGIDFASEQGKQIEKDIRKGIVDQLVERQIWLDEAKKRNITVTDKQVDDKLAEIKKGFPDEAAFEKALTDNGMKLDELKTRVREGLTYEAIIADVTKDTQVTDAEVRASYDKNQNLYQKPEEVNARHILVKDEKKAKEIHAKLKAGGNFDALAKEHSEDPGSKATGGDMGFFGRGRMVPEFEKAAFSLKKDEISGLVKTQFGYHILKGGEHKQARTQPFDEVKAEIKDKMVKERQQAEFQKWMTAQKEKAKIEYKTGFDPKAISSQAPAAGGAPAGAAPAGKPADDGHGHGADDGHGHGADDGHGHGPDDGHGH